ncbi:MAG: tetratricopeptide repeat protein [Bryobacteraceae bacterium]
MRSAARERSRAPNGATMDAALVRQQLEKILAAAEFANASRLQQFLAFVVDEKLNGAETIKETALAIQVFNRRSSFDPSGDSVVRVAAGNLRIRLRDYYLSSGRDDPIVIELPKGSYVPLFHEKAAEGGAPAPSAAGFLWRIVAGFAIIVLAACSIAYWVVKTRQNQTFSSIAVLPFLNLSNNPDNEYLTDGFVEEVTTGLAQVDGLQVVARSSAFQFRGKSPDIRTAGRQLGVETMLEGSVHTVDGRLRISAQLIKVADGFHVWSRTWEGDAGDIFTIQDDLIRSVAGALRHPSAVRTKPPHDLEAYDLYLKGLYFKDRVTSADLRRSVSYLEQSTGKDPQYAPAWAALGFADAELAYHAVQPEPETIARARAAATRALELDDTLADAHAVLAWIRYFYDWNWAESERGLQRAVALNPNSSWAHDWYSQELLSVGRFDEALQQARRALLLDPLNFRVSTNVGVVLYCAHRYDEAIRQCRQATEIDPHYYPAWSILGDSFQEKRMYGEAAAALQRSVAEYPKDSDTAGHLAMVLTAMGRKDEAGKLVAALEHPAAGEPMPWYQLAYVHLAMGDKDRAVEALDQSFQQRSSDMVVLTVDPVFDSLHRHPGFLALAKKMGLPAPR